MSIIGQYLNIPTTPPPTPDPVQETLSISNNINASASENTITIYWDTAANATNYEVKWGKNNEWTFSSKDNYPNLNATSLSIGNLEPDVLYNITVSDQDKTGHL